MNQPVQTEGKADPAVPTESSVAQVSFPQAPMKRDLPVQREELKSFQFSNIDFEISNQGFGLRNVKLNNFNQRNKEAVLFKSSFGADLFELRIFPSMEKVNFQITNSTEKSISGLARVGNSEIVRTIIFDPDEYSFNNEIRIINKEKSVPSVAVLLNNDILNIETGSIFAPALDHQDVVVNHTGTAELVHVTGVSENIKKSFSGVRMFGSGTRYFASALIDDSPIIPELKVESDLKIKKLTNVMIYLPSLAEGSETRIAFKTFVGPKQLDILKNDPYLPGLIDFGFFSTIAKYLLNLMKWFNGFVHNWGYSIILLTILVRILVLPFNIFSYQSMKRMQTVQPQIQALRDKYKDDQKMLNQEIMNLMRENKVNPLGGCLPMLLQMPVFFALYQVLSQTVDLYQAPFIFWIEDLSIKDPYFVLPVLMGVAMFIQQKITPTTMDPTQAKVMQFLPILFALMTFGLPSGLTLYIFVSTVFGVIQQQIFMKDSKVKISLESKARA
jgi:YidC/Oxa1 family membrane protein insertase